METIFKPQLKMSLAMNESAPPVIETHDLAKTYKGVLALRPLDLQVQEHRAVPCMPARVPFPIKNEPYPISETQSTKAPRGSTGQMP